MLERGSRRRRSAWRWAGRGLKVGVPVGFVVLTIANIVSLTHEGPATSPTATTSPGPSQEVKIAVAGDIGSNRSGQATIEQMPLDHPDLYLALGDLGGSGAGTQSRWCGQVRAAIGPVAPFEIVAGVNEEDGSAGRLDAYTECLPDRMNVSGQYGQQYYFDLGRLARIIMISPDLTLDGKYHYYGNNNADLRWVASAIDGARTAGIEWVIVGMNKSCLSAGVYYCKIYQDLFSLLIDKHVDLVLSAGEHSYQRSKQISAPRPGCPAVLVDSYNPGCVANASKKGQFHRGDGTVVVISGSASDDLYPIVLSDPTAPYFEATSGKNLQPRRGFLLLILTKSSMSGTFSSSGAGKFADQFTIASEGPR
jgi:hypothetical protein